MSGRAELIATLAERLLGRRYEVVHPEHQGHIYRPERRETIALDSPEKAVEMAVRILDLAGRA
jgi:hypothetical protein